MSLAKVARLSEEAGDARLREAAARVDRDAAIRAARAAGATVSEIVAAAGLSTPRVTQILAGRRTLSRR